MIILLAVIVVAVIAALASVVLVSLASKREDSAQSLSGRPSGRLEAVARRILGFHGDGIACRPAAGQNRSRPGNRALDGTGQNRTGQNRTGQNRTGQNRTGTYGTAQDGPGIYSMELGDQPDVPHLVG